MSRRERWICRLSQWWCDRWVRHDCNGSLSDRIICRFDSQPFFVWWAQNIYDKYGIYPD